MDGGASHFAENAADPGIVERLTAENVALRERDKSSTLNYGLLKSAYDDAISRLRQADAALQSEIARHAETQRLAVECDAQIKRLEGQVEMTREALEVYRKKLPAYALPAILALAALSPNAVAKEKKDPIDPYWRTP